MILHYMTTFIVLTLIIPTMMVCGLAAVQPPPLSKTADHFPLAQRAMEFFDASTDPFHAVQTSVTILKKSGFVKLEEGEHYSDGVIRPGGKYYYSRNKSTLVAFVVGQQWSSNSSGFKIIGGHTDSPNLRVKPRSKRTAASCIQIGVECYGGGLWHTWFDRDLGLSGRVLVRSPSFFAASDAILAKDNNKNESIFPQGSQVNQHLVRIDRPLLRISNLAIHLQTTKEREAFAVNKEDHLSPILAMEIMKVLSGSNDSDDEVNKKVLKPTFPPDGWSEYQEPALIQLLATELCVDVKDIVDFELNLFDVQKAAVGGAFSEFVYSARLDNLASCFMAVQALSNHAESGKVECDSDISMIVLYDHEEVGSNSAVGAASPIIGEAVRRISATLCDKDEASLSVKYMNDIYEACLRRSFVLSSDQAHAVHPNYASKHEKMHQPKMNQGMVIKRNANQRYATNAISGFIIREIARLAGLPPVQEFVVRQDCGCGSTIGPIISAATGIRTVDLGCPQLSMHSIREVMGINDIANGLELFEAFFTHFREVDNSIDQ